MLSIFDYLSYRSGLKNKLQEVKKTRPGWTLQRCAEKSGIQPPYLTNVLKERAHLNPDQLFSLAQTVGFNADETEYCLLLLDWERSAQSARKALLKEKIEKIRKEMLKSEAHLSKDLIASTTESDARYFTNPELILISFFFLIDEFSKAPEKIAGCLNISYELLNAYIHELQELKIIRKVKGRIELLKQDFHLPKDSPLCRPHLLLMHYRALQHQQLLDEKDKYNFSVTFTADERTRERIQREFLDFLGRIEGYVKDAPSEQVYQIHFDLFRWSK